MPGTGSRHPETLEERAIKTLIPVLLLPSCMTFRRSHDGHKAFYKMERGGVEREELDF